MTGPMTGNAMRVGTRGISRSARWNSTPVSTRQPHQRRPAGSARCSSCSSIVDPGVAQEHVVERRPRHRDRGGHDALAAQQLHDPRHGRGAVGQLERDAAPAARDAHAARAQRARPRRGLPRSPPGRRSRRRRRPRPFSSSGVPRDDDHAAVDDREPVAQAIGLLEVVRRQEQRDALAPAAAAARPRAPRATSGRHRWSARRGTAGAAGARGRRPGRCACASRPSTCAPAGRRPPRARTASAARRRARAPAPREPVQAAHHDQVLATGRVAREPGLLHREADRAAHRGRLAHDVVPGHRRRAPRSAAAACRACASWSSCRRRSARAGRTPHPPRCRT